MATIPAFGFVRCRERSIQRRIRAGDHGENVRAADPYVSQLRIAQRQQMQFVTMQLASARDPTGERPQGLQHYAREPNVLVQLE